MNGLSSRRQFIGAVTGICAVGGAKALSVQGGSMLRIAHLCDPQFGFITGKLGMAHRAKEHYEKNKDRLEDKIYRSMGELAYARFLPENEAMNRLSDLRLGVACGFLKDVDERQLMLLLNTIGQASVQKRCGEALDLKERDRKRAEFVREVLLKKKETKQGGSDV